jgi:hypothetical protein
VDELGAALLHARETRPCDQGAQWQPGRAGHVDGVLLRDQQRRVGCDSRLEPSANSANSANPATGEPFWSSWGQEGGYHQLGQRLWDASAGGHKLS